MFLIVTVWDILILIFKVQVLPFSSSMYLLLDWILFPGFGRSDPLTCAVLRRPHQSPGEVTESAENPSGP